MAKVDGAVGGGVERFGSVETKLFVDGGGKVFQRVALRTYVSTVPICFPNHLPTRNSGTSEGDGISVGPVVTSRELVQTWGPAKL